MSSIELLPLNDLRWPTYRGGYRTPCDIVPLIQRLQTEGTSEGFWKIAWEELHHQADVGEATYALVPYIVDHQSRQRDIDEQVFHYLCRRRTCASGERQPTRASGASVLLRYGT